MMEEVLYKVLWVLIVPRVIGYGKFLYPVMIIELYLYPPLTVLGMIH